MRSGGPASFLIVAAILLAASATAANSEAPAHRVSPGSSGHQWKVSVTNPSDEARIDQVALEFVAKPDWLEDLSIDSDSDGPLEAKETREFRIEFSISESAPPKARSALVARFLTEAGVFPDRPEIRLVLETPAVPAPFRLVEITGPDDNSYEPGSAGYARKGSSTSRNNRFERCTWQDSFRIADAPLEILPDRPFGFAVEYERKIAGHPNCGNTVTTGRIDSYQNGSTKFQIRRRSFSATLKLRFNPLCQAMDAIMRDRLRFFYVVEEEGGAGYPEPLEVSQGTGILDTADPECNARIKAAGRSATELSFASFNTDVGLYWEDWQDRLTADRLNKEAQQRAEETGEPVGGQISPEGARILFQAMGSGSGIRFVYRTVDEGEDWFATLPSWEHPAFDAMAADTERLGSEDQPRVRPDSGDTASAVEAASVLVADVSGLPAADAKSRLEAQGLDTAITVARPARRRDEAFTVIAQSPAGGAPTAAGSTVDITVHGNYVKLSVPDVVGRAATDAKTRLEKDELAVQIEVGRPASSESQAYTVAAQNPPPGESVESGDTVFLTVFGGYVAPVGTPLPSQAGPVTQSGPWRLTERRPPRWPKARFDQSGQRWTARDGNHSVMVEGNTADESHFLPGGLGVGRLTWSDPPDTVHPGSTIQIPIRAEIVQRGRENINYYREIRSSARVTERAAGAVDQRDTRQQAMGKVVAPQSGDSFTVSIALGYSRDKPVVATYVYKRNGATVDPPAMLSSSPRNDSRERVSVKLDGGWNSSFARSVDFEVRGDGSVRGTFPYMNGRIIGHFDGRVMEGYWVTENYDYCKGRMIDGSGYWGRVRFEYNPENGRMKGMYGYCDREMDTPWNLWR